MRTSIRRANVTAILVCAAFVAPAYGEGPRDARPDAARASPGGMQTPNAGAPGVPEERRGTIRVENEAAADAVAARYDAVRREVERNDLDAAAKDIREAIALLGVRKSAVVDPAAMDIDESMKELSGLAETVESGRAPEASKLKGAFTRAEIALRMALNKAP